MFDTARPRGSNPDAPDVRPQAGAIVHLHSTYATAIGCLAEPGETAPIPPLTPYFAMRVGRSLPVIRSNASM